MTKEKLDIKKTMFLSVGFFASTLAWSIYNAFVPQILEGFIASTTLIGLIMTIDNVFGVIFQPLFGGLSDKTRTRFGRRMPYILIGIPVCAIAFAFIPRMTSLWSLMAVLILFTFVMSVWRAPTVALMPDITPGPLRSQANGIVNLLGGVGGLVAFAVGGVLFNVGGFPLPFLMSAIVMMLAVLVMALFVKEPPLPPKTDEDKKAEKVKLTKDEKKSLLLILFGVFFWFTGYNAVETFFTLYATNTLEMGAGDASITLALFSLTFLIFAVPAGFIGAKIGRKKAILIGLIGIIVLFSPMMFLANVWLVRICLLLAGLCWAMININSLPMVVRLSGKEKIGTFIGYYYFFSFSSQIVSPILYGFIRDVTGSYKTLFVYSCIAFAIAIAGLFFVRHGEDEGGETSAKETALEALEELGD